jgi:DNA-binding GntR family transcriptional regulator
MKLNDARRSDEMSLHSTVYDIVRGNIESGRLQPGTFLNEHRLARQLSVSRAPIARALQRLEADGLISRNQVRGYLVSGAPKCPARELPLLDLSEAALERVRGRPEWEKIWDQVESDLIGCMPFGRYKVTELAMAEHYKVSRTITRDLLARLEARALVHRIGRSQCYLRQLTPELMSDLYEVRTLLEPTALLRAAPQHRREHLERMRQDLVDAERRYPNISVADLSRYENDLHIVSTEACPNKELLNFLRQSQMLVLATNRLIQLYLGMPQAEPFLAEHRLVIDLLLSGSPEAAAVALEAHLSTAVRKQHARLADLKAHHQPVVPPYLLEIGEGS